MRECGSAGVRECGSAGVREALRGKGGLSSRGASAPNQPARRTVRAVGSSRGRILAGARQRHGAFGLGAAPGVPLPRPLPAQTACGEGRTSIRGGGFCASAGAPHPQPFPRKLRGGREPVGCVRPIQAHFRSPPPLRSGDGGRGEGAPAACTGTPPKRSRILPSPACGRGAGGEGSREMRRRQSKRPAVRKPRRNRGPRIRDRCRARACTCPRLDPSPREG